MNVWIARAKGLKDQDPTWARVTLDPDGRAISALGRLQRRIVERHGEAAGLSQAPIHRVVEGPELLKLRTLDALCGALETTPAELLTDDVAGVPDGVLRTLLANMAAASAHYILCSGQRGGTSLMSHPGDPVGKVLAWLCGARVAPSTPWCSSPTTSPR